MQTHTPNPRRVAAGKRIWEKLQRQRAEAVPQPESGNGRHREDIANAFDDVDVSALHEARRLLLGNGPTAKPVTLVDAVIVVQDALQRGELELVAEDGRPAFYKVVTTISRERIA